MIPYEHHSPSSLNLFAASPAMWVLEKVLGEKQPVGSPAHRGSAVEAGVAYGLNDPEAPIADCTKTALREFDNRGILQPDPRKARYRETIPSMVERATKHLRQYGDPTGMQGFVEWRPGDLRMPIIGFYDFVWSQHGITVDLKTTENMPSEIKIPHARQISLYVGDTNHAAHLVYVTPKRIEPYIAENIPDHRAALLRIAMSVERLLSLSDDPQFFVGITAPDLESFYWKNPLARALAFKHWGV